eukprot:CAMPEP_0184687374 /NCGR_PEP_ID=MMETSP0312-20130426/26091_1 /TAXON_ID=31354 /ORGANISM="Compsopogon coeruleus, Strain SAG 36.94" /LENGTH=596 /DNA_ID=CAMNT_0027143423 /DNA_START=390 /DNA_END=2180 /DNA_ORIENTATION=-
MTSFVTGLDGRVSGFRRAMSCACPSRSALTQNIGVVRRREACRALSLGSGVKGADEDWDESLPIRTQTSKRTPRGNEEEEKPPQVDREDQIKQLMRQLEYYFSNNNLDTDKFMNRSLLACGGYMEVDVLANFARVMMIARGEDPNPLLIEAAARSDFLELFYDSGRIFIGRLKPYTAREAGIRSQLKARGAKNLTVPPRKGRIGEEAGAPCKYFCAGYCDRGRSCPLSHDMEYARAVEMQWLEPANQFGSRMLQELVHRKKLPANMARPARFVATDYVANVKEQMFEYFAVLDLEGRDEIIEFPVLIFHVPTMREVGRFHRWIRPVELFKNRELNPESEAIPFLRAMEEFQDWMLHTMHVDVSSKDKPVAFVTCGDWDLRVQIPKQCSISRGRVPKYLRRWINIKIAFNNFYRSSRPVTGMRGMLRKLNMLKDGEVEGTHHLGMDDVENISRVLVRMLEDGAMLRFTGKSGSSQSVGKKNAFFYGNIGNANLEAEEDGYRNPRSSIEGLTYQDSDADNSREDERVREGTPIFDPDRYIDPKSRKKRPEKELEDSLLDEEVRWLRAKNGLHVPRGMDDLDDGEEEEWADYRRRKAGR